MRSKKKRKMSFKDKKQTIEDEKEKKNRVPRTYI